MALQPPGLGSWRTTQLGVTWKITSFCLLWTCALTVSTVPLLLNWKRANTHLLTVLSVLQIVLCSTSFIQSFLIWMKKPWFTYHNHIYEHLVVPLIFLKAHFHSFPFLLFFFFLSAKTRCRKTMTSYGNSTMSSLLFSIFFFIVLSGFAFWLLLISEMTLCRF